MIVNRQALLKAQPILNMIDKKVSNGTVTYGLSEAGYDIRIKQTIIFKPAHYPNMDDPYCFTGSAAAKWLEDDGSQVGIVNKGRFILASTIEEFKMPNNLVGIVHDKSSWARQGLSVFNTVIEPGWNGFLTLELVYNGNEPLIIPSGSGIAQVVFHETSNTATYTGRYQNQEDKPVEALKVEE